MRSILGGFLFPFLVGLFSWMMLLPVADVSAAGRSPDKSIDELIADLRSDDFATREAATRALKERVEAVPALRKLRRSADLDARRRAAEILTALERKRATLGLAKAKALGKAGRAVEVGDRLASAAKYAVPGDEGWDALTRLAEEMVAHTGRHFPPGWKSYCFRQLPVGEFRQFAERFNPKEIAQSKIEIDTGNGLAPEDPKERASIKLLKETCGRLVLRGEQVTLKADIPGLGLRGGMISASGQVLLSRASNSVIVAGGDVKIVDELRNCILICDGDVELMKGQGSDHSIILARGRATYDKYKTIIWNCLIRSGRMVLLPDGKKLDLIAGDADPLAFVKFFELADVGIVAEVLPRLDKSDGGGVRLKEVRKESPFAAGLRAGDVIIAIEEKKTPTTEILRKVLRRKLAESGPILTFTVSRSGRTLELPLAVND